MINGDFLLENNNKILVKKSRFSDTQAHNQVTRHKLQKDFSHLTILFIVDGLRRHDPHPIFPEKAARPSPLSWGDAAPGRVV